MQHLGKQIALLRARLGMSQREFAEQARLSRAYVIDLEQGRETPNLEILLRIAVALKAEPWEMLLSPDLSGTTRAGLLDETSLSGLH